MTTRATWYKPPPMTPQRYAYCRWFAKQTLEIKLDVLKKLSDEEATILKYTWQAWARDKQLDGWNSNWWTHWAVIAGRGFGKSKIGAEWIRSQAESNEVDRMILVGRTAGDIRDTMLEGESGLLSISPPWFFPTYNPSKRRVTWPNGAIALCFSAEEPDALRGPQCSRAWCDERAAWDNGKDGKDEAWSNLMMGMRLGTKPQCLTSTTPRPLKSIKKLIKNPTTLVTRGSTYENKDNLAPAFIDEIVSQYAGTRLGRQELEAEILDDIEGALWRREEMIDAHRVVRHPELVLVVVAVDPPAGTMGDDGEGAECGIVVSGLGEDGHGYTLADFSMSGSPREWGKQAMTAYVQYQANYIVAEVNNGGKMVKEVLDRIAEDEKIIYSYHEVHASRGKQTRAEPVATLAEQGRLHHVGEFKLLEDQMCNWVPGMGMPSPDRLDAYVWSYTKLMVQKKSGGIVIPDDEEEKQEVPGYQGHIIVPESNSLITSLVAQDNDSPWW